MKRFALPAAVALCLGLCSCIVLSVHPFVKEEDAIFDEALLGTWDVVEQNAQEHMVLTKHGDKGYRLTYHEAKGSSTWDAWLTTIGEVRYLDIEPAPGDEGKMPFLLPTHGLMRIDLKGDDLKLGFMNFEWLKEKAEKGGGKVDGLGVVETKQGLLLTAGTEELRAFVAANHKEPKMFDIEGKFKRRKAAAK